VPAPVGDQRVVDHPVFWSLRQQDDRVDEEQALGFLGCVLVFPQVGPHLIQGLDAGGHVEVRQADVLAGDDPQALPAVLGVAGQVHVGRPVERVVDAVRIPQAWGRPRTRPLRLAGDKGYDVPWFRDWLRRRHITPIIAEKHKPHGRKPGRPLVLDTDAYRRRNVIERSISWLKHARRIATRFEKLALNFLAMLKLAMIQRYLRNYLRDTT
jgi:transposase